MVSERVFGLADSKMGTFRLRWKLTAKARQRGRERERERETALREEIVGGYPGYTKIAMATNLSGGYH